MKRKYIDELGVKPEDTPQGWCYYDDVRMKHWQKQREEYGFDERETWCIDYSFILWFYERLMMYNEIKVVDKNKVRIEYKGETMSLQEAIDRMIEGCRLYITKNVFDLTDEEWRKVEDVYHLFAVTHNYLWW